MAGWVGGWVDGWMDGWMDGCAYVHTCPWIYKFVKIHEDVD